MSGGKKKIALIFAKLDAQGQSSLLDFAEYLLAKSSPEEQVSTVRGLLSPTFEVAPESETVIAALKRMRRVYPMLDTGDLFNEASSLVTSNLMGGRPTKEVIDEIESLFDKYYQEYAKSSVT